MACSTGCRADCGNAPIDCPVGSSGVACSGRGVCLPATGTCRCFLGHTSAACDGCASGLLPLPSGACPVVPRARRVSCDNGVRDGNEEGVDCGPVCGVACVDVAGNAPTSAAAVVARPMTWLIVGGVMVSTAAIAAIAATVFRLRRLGAKASVAPAVDCGRDTPSCAGGDDSHGGDAASPSSDSPRPESDDHGRHHRSAHARGWEEGRDVDTGQQSEEPSSRPQRQRHDDDSMPEVRRASEVQPLAVASPRRRDSFYSRGRVKQWQVVPQHAGDGGGGGGGDPRTGGADVSRRLTSETIVMPTDDDGDSIAAVPPASRQQRSPEKHRVQRPPRRRLSTDSSSDSADSGVVDPSAIESPRRGLAKDGGELRRAVGANVLDATAMLPSVPSPSRAAAATTASSASGAATTAGASAAMTERLSSRDTAVVRPPAAKARAGPAATAPMSVPAVTGVVASSPGDVTQRSVGGVTTVTALPVQSDTAPAQPATAAVAVAGGAVVEDHCDRRPGPVETPTNSGTSHASPKLAIDANVSEVSRGASPAVAGTALSILRSSRELMRTASGRRVHWSPHVAEYRSISPRQPGASDVGEDDGSSSSDSMDGASFASSSDSDGADDADVASEASVPPCRRVPRLVE